MLAFLVLVFTASAQSLHGNRQVQRAQILKRVSALVLLALVMALVTGLVVLDSVAAPKYAALFVTPYGGWIFTKITSGLLMLAIALRIHLVLLPALGTNGDAAAVARQRLRIWGTVEGLFGLAIGVATVMLASAHPPHHIVIQDWPYPFRFDLAGTWGMGIPEVVNRVWVGITLFILAGGALLLGLRSRWGASWRLGIPITLTICALAIGLPPLTVPSFPETYRPTPIPFEARSVAHGLELFSANCVPCHGPQAKGDGVLAKTLPQKPKNLLTEAHADMHTVGDFFHWLTNGIPGTGMPPWGEKFSKEDRWDLVNLIHANLRGYQGRLISPHIQPNRPYLAPPDFSYVASDGTSGNLKDFRRENLVLLVMFSWPESQDRLGQLNSLHGVLSSHKTKVLLVPLNALDQHATEAVIKDTLFPLVTEGASDIARAYSLFRRTITNPDLIGEGTIPKHMEFLIDPYGYLRARWIPGIDKDSWADGSLLTQQIHQLTQEGEIMPPPPIYVHESSGGMHMGMGGMGEMGGMSGMGGMGGMDMGGMEMKGDGMKGDMDMKGMKHDMKDMKHDMDMKGDNEHMEHMKVEPVEGVR